MDGVFVGRTDELARFRALLAEMPVGKRRGSRVRASGSDARKSAGARRSRVVLVHGLGGTGKSRLLTRFREMADGALADSPVQSGQVCTAWLDFEDEEREKPALYAVADGPSLVTMLDGVQQAVIGVFDCDAKARGMAVQAFADYRDGAARMPQYAARFADVIAESRQPGSQFTSQDAAVLLRSLASAGLAAGGHPAGLLGLGPAQIAASAHAAGHLSEAAARAVTGKKPSEISLEEYDLLTDPVRELTRRVAAAVRAISAAFALVIFLDTGEVIGGIGWSRLRRVMTQTGSRVMWVVGARFETEAEAGVDSPVAQFVRDIGTVHLALMVPTRFDDETIGQYLTARIPDCRYSQEQIDIIARFTRGLPLALSLAAELLDQGQRVEEISQEVQDGVPSAIVSRVTRRYLVHAERQDNAPDDSRRGDMAKILGLAIAYGDLRTDPALLAAMWDVADSLNAFNDLARRHDFVLDTSRRLHDDVRDAIRIDLLDPYRRTSVREMNQRVLRIAVAMLPQNESAWRCYASALNLAGRLADAVSAYDRALDLDPANAESHTEQRRILRRIENIAPTTPRLEITGNRASPEFTRLLTPAEVAALFRVDPKTVTRWAKEGKLTSVRTMGGHRRYPEAEVRALLDQISGTTRPLSGRQAYPPDDPLDEPS